MEYQVLRRLSNGYVPGDVVSEDDFRPGVVEILVRKGALAPVEIEEGNNGTDDGSAAECSGATRDWNGRGSLG
jgi:hypothetical protein